MKQKILVVEDEKRMNEIICDYLDMAGYEAFSAFDGVEALNIFEKESINLVILDIMMPKLDGFSVCRRLRKKSDVLIIILSALSEEEDKLTGFELGADEYVTKPFSPKVLVAQVKALFGRVSKEDNLEPTGLAYYGDLMIDKRSYKAMINNHEIKLTAKEYELLILLTDHQGKVFTREALISSIWGYDYYGDGRIIDTNIKTLRKKLEHCSVYIVTLIGIGYKFEVKS